MQEDQPGKEDEDERKSFDTSRALSLNRRLSLCRSYRSGRQWGRYVAQSSWGINLLVVTANE